jgi:hypothetical protein
MRDANSTFAFYQSKSAMLKEQLLAKKTTKKDISTHLSFF